MRIRERLSEHLSEGINKYRLVCMLAFMALITLLAWQSDDAYHAYVMAKHLVEGHGFVYNIGERASASSCPLFTLVIALGYLVFRNMFMVSLLICIVFSSLAAHIVFYDFCDNRKRLFCTFIVLAGSCSFVSYTTSGLENSLLFFLAALFYRYYYTHEAYNGKQLWFMGFLVSLIAMTRMDAVLMFVPAILFVYLAERERVSFFKAVLTGILSLLPFIMWELFSLFYYGFPFPNTAYVKLGTGIALSEYIYRGLQYVFISTLCDLPLMAMIAFMIAAAIIARRARVTWAALGVFVYILYVIYIGGDFMLGRHFTVAFLISVMTCLHIMQKCIDVDFKRRRAENALIITIFASVFFSVSSGLITDQFLFGHENSLPIADERAGYFRYTSLYNNIISLIRTGELCIRQAWNEQGIDELRARGLDSGLVEMAPGISVYYNSDMYLSDWYGLMDPFLSKLPGVKEDNWRVGHIWRDPPYGYEETLAYKTDQIENPSLQEYYNVIRFVTRGKLFDKDRIRAIIDLNLGRYDHLLEDYKRTLDETGRQVRTGD
ncbi:MAG TPA: hypothetical protein DCL38_01780 [Lachnospiraceae bacterium]|nr:hypothetical protein [Lachnospiraceae bacterium]